MNRAVAVGSLLFAVTLVGWLCQGGHGEWPQEPPVAADDCGVAQPEKEDPSPGDSTECWEYKNSDGWVRLFDCVEELSCPTVENEPVPGEGCACLKIGDGDSFSFTMPTWTIKAGKKTKGPDNPNCGDTVETPIEPEGSDSWVVTGGGSAASASPLSGSGDAAFTVTGLDEGSTSFAVTWKYTLSMEEDCPKEFTVPGPVVTVDVYKPYIVPPTPRNPPPPEYVFPPLLAPDGSADAGQIQYSISHNLHCAKICSPPDCEKYRIEGKFHIEITAIKIVKCYTVKADGCPHVKGTCVSRSSYNMDLTHQHELKHAELWYDFIDEWNREVSALGEFNSCDDAQAALNIMMNNFVKAKVDMKKRQSSHCPDFDGEVQYGATQCGNEQMSKIIICPP